MCVRIFDRTIFCVTNYKHHDSLTLIFFKSEKTIRNKILQGAT